jgi:cytoplasmic iron level regulating protein YaaA (DUF328/UPF0246 family)
MLALLSPAKTLDLTPLSGAVRASTPVLLKEAGVVVKHLQRLSLVQLKALLGVSDSLAKVNLDRYKQFDAQAQKQAAFAFDGPAFRGLAASRFTSADLDFAQDHLRILSGVYGVLRPCDLVRPYRLDMGKKLRVGDSEGLYKFWGTRISEALGKELPEANNDIKINSNNKGAAPAQFVLNCASAEYVSPPPPSLPAASAAAPAAGRAVLWGKYGNLVRSCGWVTGGGAAGGLRLREIVRSPTVTPPWSGDTRRRVVGGCPIGGRGFVGAPALLFIHL